MSLTCEIMGVTGWNIYLHLHCSVVQHLLEGS